MKVWLNLLRVNQYVKNLVVFFPLFFAGKILDTSLFESTILAFVCFCLSASAVYIFNDSRDVHYDREHPKKRFRPLASGEIRVSRAIKVAFLLFVFGIPLLVGVVVFLELCHHNGTYIILVQTQIPIQLVDMKLLQITTTINVLNQIHFGEKPNLTHLNYLPMVVKKLETIQVSKSMRVS